MKVSITEIYYISILIMLLIAFLFIFDGFFSNNIIKQKKSLRKIYMDFINNFADKTQDDTFNKAGIKLSLKKYTAFRNLIGVFIMIVAMYNLSNGYMQESVKATVFTGTFMILTSPKEELIKGHRSPFRIAIDFIYKKRQILLDKELVEVIQQMKGLIITNNDNISADYIFTRLVPYCKVSKTIFIQTHAFLMTGRRKAASEFFANSYNTNLGRKFAAILLKLDKLPAVEYLKELEILQKNITEEKKTTLERKRQTKISIIFTLAGVQLAIIIFDYIYIVIVDAINALHTL